MSRVVVTNEDFSLNHNFLKPNYIGRMLLFHSSQSVALYRCRGDAMLRGCRILLALKAYKEDHGHLPDTLEILVPNYLEQVPLDPFDGKPMRYSGKKNVVYSIGDNLKDDGGSDADRNTGKEPQNRYAHWNGLDIVFKADF